MRSITTHRRARLGAAAAVIVLSAALSPIALVAPAAADSDGVFEPIATADALGPSAFPTVVTNGTTFVQANRVQLPMGQYISVRTSEDGGRNWTTRAFAAGEAGGATRPAMAMDGDNVALVFTGAYLPAGRAIEEEAPYLTVSTNAGTTWSAPRRLDGFAGDPVVAQAGTRTWVAWSAGGVTKLRGTTDGGTTWFAQQNVAGGPVAMAGSGNLAALLLGTSFEGHPVSLLLALQGASVPPVAMPVADPSDPVDISPLGVAVADGRISVLVRNEARERGAAPTTFEVRGASASGVFDSRSVISVDSEYPGVHPSIDAGRGLVAVSTSDPTTGIVSVATSSDGGQTFGAATPIAEQAGTAISQVSVVRRASDLPIPRFTWSVPPTFTDDDGDGFIDPANDRNDLATDQDRVAAGDQQEVTVDACSTLPPPGRTIAEWRWSTVAPDGSLTTLAPTGCSFKRKMVSGESLRLRLDVRDTGGKVASTLQTVAPRNLLVASIGDSVASGEGNPHTPLDPDTDPPTAPVWQDRPCHRSVLAGPALAAQQLEQSDPHTSVTFVQLACSGAAVVDVPEVAGVDDPDTGGLLDQYAGVTPEDGSLRPSQLSQLQTLSGGRNVDALLVSTGANDAKFSAVVKSCIFDDDDIPCSTTSVRTGFEQRLATLPSRYDRLATAISDLGIAAKDVHLTQYFDPTTDQDGVVEMRCAFDFFGQRLDDDEAEWARDGVIGGLNQAVADAASAHGWTFVGGIAQAFQRHGYCSDDPWIVQLGGSVQDQGWSDGAFHPNAAGHIAYGKAIYASLQQSLTPLPSQAKGLTDELQQGDLAVISGGANAMYVTSVRDGSGTPIPLGTRRVDRIVLGDGAFSWERGQRLALSPSSTVAAWTELTRYYQTEAQAFVARVAVRPNASLRSIAVVQGPNEGRLLVSGRDTLVAATVEADIDGPQAVDVEVQVRALPADAADPGRPIISSVKAVTLKPGTNRLLLPEDETFQVLPGENIEAKVTVHDPLGAEDVDAVDNQLITTAAGTKTAEESRALQLQFIAPDVQGATPVPCTALASVARKQVAFARAALPVVQGGMSGTISCSPFSEVPQTYPGVLAYLTFLDGIARTVGSDGLVAVVPDGWLQTAVGQAVGAASAGHRAVFVERSAGELTLAHELTHTYGYLHEEKDFSKHPGAWVDRREYRDGYDWMVPIQPRAYWTSPAVWDFLAARIGPPGGIPAPPDPLSDQLEITGSIDTLNKSIPGQWTPGDTGSPRPDDGADLTRLVAEQVDGSGTVLASDPIGVSEAGGSYVGGTPTPIGSTYVGRITLRPATASIRLVLDGDVVETRPVVAPPTLAVTAPSAGTSASRGGPLHVAWTTSDATLSTDILVTQDDGTTWKPLAVGVTGTSADLTVPRDLVDGPARLRVVQHTATSLASAESGDITIDGGDAGLPERIVGVQVDAIDFTVPGSSMPTVPGKGLITMDPDGTGLETIVDTVPPGPGQPGFVPLRPDWSPDGTHIAFDAEVDGRRDLWIVDRDGSNRRRLTDATSADGRQVICADWSPDGTKLVSLTTTGLNRDEIGQMTLVKVDVATGVVTNTTWNAQSYYHPIEDIPCPRWTPDGGEILFQSAQQSRQPNFQDHFVFVLDSTTFRSKYALSPNNGALELNSAYAHWLNPAPSNDDRFAVSSLLFSSQSYLDVAEPKMTTLILPGDVIVDTPLPTFWRRLIGNGSGAVGVPPGTERVGFGSMGFTPDGTEVWATTRSSLTPPTRTIQDFSSGFTTYQQVVSQQPGAFCRFSLAALPEDTSLDAPAQCYAPGGNGSPLASLADTYTDPGQPIDDSLKTGIAMADWSSAKTGGPTSTPVVVEDPATIPHDPFVPDPEDVTDPMTAGDPAPGADEGPSGRTLPVDASFQVEEGSTTEVTLPGSDDGTTPFELVDRPTGPVVVEAIGGADPNSTGPDHRLRITAPAGSAGTVTFHLRSGAGTVTITITVFALARPTAVDDTVEVPANTETILAPDALLGNDEAPASPLRRSPRAAAGLELASVSGFTGGVAQLLDDGTVRILATKAGTFRYVVADASGRTDQGSVTVKLAGGTTSTTTSTSTTTTSTTTTSTTTSTPGGSTTTTEGGSTTTTENPPTGPGTGGSGTGSDGGSSVDDGTLARTGSDAGPLVAWGLALVAVGAGAVAFARRRRPAT